MSFRGGELIREEGLNGRGAYKIMQKSSVQKNKNNDFNKHNIIFPKVIKTNTNRYPYHYRLLCPRLRLSLRAPHQRINHFKQDIRKYIYKLHKKNKK